MVRKPSKKGTNRGNRTVGKQQDIDISKKETHEGKKDVVDYGKAGDSFASAGREVDDVGLADAADVERNSVDDDDDDVDSEESKSGGDDIEDDEVDVDEDSESDSEDDDEEISEGEAEGDAAAALFKHTVDDDDDSQEDGDDGDDDADDKVRPAFGSSSSSEQYTFDLRNLLAVSNDQLPSNSLYTDKTKRAVDESTISIPLDSGHPLNVDEDYLLAKATAGCSELIRALWQLPTEQSDAGPLVKLPSYDEIRLPRALVSPGHR
jgi:Ribosome biogenesis regulatory protein (RRS1)